MARGELDPITKALKARRVALGLTQAGLSKVSGVNRSTITEVEGGLHGYTVYTAMKLAQAMGAELRVVTADEGADLATDIVTRVMQLPSATTVVFTGPVILEGGSR